jgi:hypothetical protein
LAGQRSAGVALKDLWFWPLAALRGCVDDEVPLQIEEHSVSGDQT